MEGILSKSQVKTLFGKYFLGKEELNAQAINLGICPIKDEPEILIPSNILENCSQDYLLILGTDKMLNMEGLNLLSLREHYGIDPIKTEPCFYNQDWYIKEKFVKETLSPGWFLIRRSVFESSRAVEPDKLVKQIDFPTAIQCAYSFFAAWFCSDEILWKHDFIWCQDLDHNGDRIYVGKYLDKYEINNNGFSVHRHLTIRNFYGAINKK